MLVPDLARPLLRRLTEPTPNAQAKLYAPDGTVVADSRVREGAGGAVCTEPLPPAPVAAPCCGLVEPRLRRGAALLPHAPGDVGPSSPERAGADWQPDVREELRMTSTHDSHEMPPYMRRTRATSCW